MDYMIYMVNILAVKFTNDAFLNPISQEGEPELHSRRRQQESLGIFAPSPMSFRLEFVIKGPSKVGLQGKCMGNISI